ncbi:hypothetical protein NE643_27400, partial [Bacteroides thetaiotaomicron]
LITGLEVDNHPVWTGEKINNQIILNQFIPFTDLIVLDNDNKDFSLTFNNLSYSDEQQKYNYRLGGWYTRLSLPHQKSAKSPDKAKAGNYIFVV